MDTRGAGATTTGDAIADAIRQTRLTAGLTQEQLAERLGDRSQHSISEWERGNATPALDMILAIDEACEVPSGTILRAAGYCPDAADALSAIIADPELSDFQRDVVLNAYRNAVMITKIERAPEQPPEQSPKRRRRKR